MTTAISSIMKFQSDRQLHKQEHDGLNEITNIFEELLESIGYDVPKENREALKHSVSNFIQHTVTTETAVPVKLLDNDTQIIEAKVDAYNDIIVFAVGAIMKLGYDPRCTLEEVSGEINSRTGTMRNGKFEKHLSAEAKSNWYKADYSKCKLLETF